jgi:hypothetical protein
LPDEGIKLPQGLLYHYTTQAGLLGILKDGVIWASGIQHLNDASEFHHSVQIALEVLQASEIPSDVRERLLPILTSVQFGWDVFVTSFSEEADDLGQWRAYGKDAGFSIGFDPQALHKLAVEQHYQLRRCEYDVHEQQALVRSLIEMAIAKTTPWVAVDTFAFARLFMEIAPTIKHPKFSVEKEWRLARLQTAPITGFIDGLIQIQVGKVFLHSVQRIQVNT